MKGIVGDLEDRYPGRWVCFIIDNLNVHYNPAIITMTMAHGHCLVFKSPYCAVNGAIKRVFNTIHTGLLSYYNKTNTMNELHNTTLLIFWNIPTFTPYFEHVGF